MVTPNEQRQYPLNARVERVEDIGSGVKSYRLCSADANALPAFSAGAHVELKLPSGLARSYSITSSDDQQVHYDIAVARDPAGRGGSVFMHDRVAEGALLEMSLPRNHFPLHQGPAHSVLIAGGIGITPIWSMIRRLGREGRTWSLHYACRSRDRAVFLDELQSAAAPGGGLHVWWDDEHGQQPLDIHGLVELAPPGAHLYCCGPAPMLESFQSATKGTPADRVHLERFSASTAPLSSEALPSFKVELARTGRVIFVPEGNTILDALMMNGIDVPYSCCEGLCGTCETRVLQGVPDHRDNLLTARARQANDAIIICCSGSRSPTLVLDL